MQSSPFDALAEDYDSAFTHSVLGTLLRRPLHERLRAAFAPGDRVLELGCGTGEDAVHLGRHGVRVLATDAAPAMIAAAQRKVEAAGLRGVVEVRRLTFADLPRLAAEDPPRLAVEGRPRVAIADLPRLAAEDLPRSAAAESHPPAFDGAFSSFGALNCAADPSAVARGLAALLRPGARALFCVMGPLVPWEWGWFLLRGEPRKALRRLRRGGAVWRGAAIRYPSIGALRRAFAPAFRATRVAALGCLLPPPYAEAWAVRHPRFLARLDRWERRWETLPPLPWLADHYLLELERR